jgi:hypothetical protein
MHSLVRSWLRRTDRFWDHLVGRSDPARRRTHLGLLPLEDRVVPTSLPAYAVGAAPGERPEVRLYDESGTLVRTVLAYEESFTGGVRAALADLTGDGVPDVATAPNKGGGPLVKVFDGATGGLVSSFLAYDPDFRGGVNVAAGDVGHGLTGVATAPESGSPPRVRVFTTDGRLRQSFLAYDPSFAGGVRVALGYATSGNATVFTAPGVGGGPHVKAFEVRTGKAVHNFMAYDESFTGGVHVAAADLTGDGVSEVVTGAGAGGGPHVRAFSGQTGKVLRDFFAADPSDRGGAAVGVAGRPGPDAQVVAVVAGAGGKQARRFDRQGTPADLFAGLVAGVSVSTPAQLAAVKTYDPDDPTPRTIDRAFTTYSAPGMGSMTPELLRAGAGQSVSPSGYSDFPVRYGDGVVQYAEEDLSSGGFGADWGVTRSWTNEQTYTQGQNIGRGWVIGQTPSLLRQVDSYSGAETVSVVTGGTAVRDFDKQTDGSYLARSGVLDTLTYDSTAGKYPADRPDRAEGLVLGLQHQPAGPAAGAVRPA